MDPIHDIAKWAVRIFVGVVVIVFLATAEPQSPTTQGLTTGPAKKVKKQQVHFRSPQAIVRKVPKKFWPKSRDKWDGIYRANTAKWLKDNCVGKTARLTGEFTGAALSTSVVSVSLKGKAFPYLGRLYGVSIKATCGPKAVDKVRRYRKVKKDTLRKAYTRIKRTRGPGGDTTREVHVRGKVKRKRGTNVTVLGTVASITITPIPRMSQRNNIEVRINIALKDCWLR